jgi:hypothetical protein
MSKKSFHVPKSKYTTPAVKVDDNDNSYKSTQKQKGVCWWQG